LISLLGNWHSNKQKNENSEAANAAQSLMQAIEAAKSTGDWTPAHTILHNNEKLFNKVYKGWLQKNEMQAQEQQKKSKSKPPDPDVQGFEQGVQQFLQKKQQQPQGAPPQGSAPKALGGYQLPGAPAPQQIQQQATSATQQAQRQDPSRGLPGGQLTSGESRQAELAGAGLAQTPKTEAEMAKYQSQMQTAALAVQKAQADAQKAMTELQLKNAEAQTAKEALVAEATVAALEKFKTKPSREYQRYTVLLDLGEKVSLRSRVEDIAVGECVRVWIRGPGVSPVYLYDANQAEVEKANGCKP